MPSLSLLNRSAAFQGVFWMVITSFLFVGMTGIVRHLGTDVPAMQAAFVRYLFGVLFIMPFLLQMFKSPPSGKIIKLFTIRGIIHGLGVILWFYAMARIPIAEVTAIGYAAPIFVTIGAALFLGERLQIRRVTGVIIGCIGTLIILRPGFQDLNLGQLSQLCATPLFAASFLIAKKLTGTQKSSVIVGMLSVFCMLTLLPGAIYQWRPLTLEETLWLALTAALATAGHYTMTRALQAAPITLTQPLNFLQLVWAVILGMALFGEPVDPYVILGGGLIISATTYIAHREMKVSKAQNKQPPSKESEAPL